jgi:hypothetical protein
MGVGHAHVECRWKLPSRDRVRKALADAFCIALYAGAEAERVFFAIEPDGDEIDRERATQALCKVGVRGARFVGDEVWEKHEAKLRRKARILVQEERARIERVAQGLVKHKTLTSEEVDCL